VREWLADLWSILGSDTRAATWYLGVILAAYFLCPKIFPVGLFQFFGASRTIAGIIAAWPIFLWGVVVTTIASIAWYCRSHGSNLELWDAEEKYKESVEMAVFAGILEELVYRWVIFYWAIVVFWALNSIAAACAGKEVMRWIFTAGLGPMADYFTFGHAHTLLYGYGWLVGLSILFSNFMFQRGHWYLGLIGWINSFYIGMFMFYLMFNYGILAAIIAHFLYDFFIFTLEYMCAVMVRAMYDRW
jgi:hypothetical protein